MDAIILHTDFYSRRNAAFIVIPIRYDIGKGRRVGVYIVMTVSNYSNPYQLHAQRQNNQWQASLQAHACIYSTYYRGRFTN